MRLGVGKAKTLWNRLRQAAAAKSSSTAVALTFASRIFSIGLNFLGGVIVARGLGPAGRGTATVISVWPIIISGVLTLGIPVALRFHIRQRNADERELLSTSLVCAFFSGLVAVLVGAVFLPSWLRQYPWSAIRYAQMMMAFAPLMALNAIIQGFLEAKGDFARSNSVAYYPLIGRVAAFTVLWKLGQLTPYTAPPCLRTSLQRNYYFRANSLKKIIAMANQFQAKLSIAFALWPTCLGT